MTKYNFYIIKCNCIIYVIKKKRVHVCYSIEMHFKGGEDTEVQRNASSLTGRIRGGGRIYMH